VAARGPPGSHTIEKINYTPARKVAAPAVSSIIEEASENPRPAWMLQLPQRLGLDLADALARHRELLADLFQRAVFVHASEPRCGSRPGGVLL